MSSQAVYCFLTRQYMSISDSTDSYNCTEFTHFTEHNMQFPFSNYSDFTVVKHTTVCHIELCSYFMADYSVVIQGIDEIPSYNYS